jgi:hypothetical protein
MLKIITLPEVDYSSPFIDLFKHLSYYVVAKIPGTEDYDLLAFDSHAESVLNIFCNALPFEASSQCANFKLKVKCDQPVYFGVGLMAQYQYAKDYYDITEPLSPEQLGDILMDTASLLAAIALHPKTEDFVTIKKQPRQLSLRYPKTFGADIELDFLLKYMDRKVYINPRHPLFSVLLKEYLEFEQVIPYIQVNDLFDGKTFSAPDFWGQPLAAETAEQVENLFAVLLAICELVLAAKYNAKYSENKGLDGSEENYG